MLSAAKIKLIRSLSRKKCRKEEGLFLAEGPKVVGELSGHFECALLAGTEKWFARQRGSVCQALESFTITEQELCRASLLQMPQEVLALFRIPARGCNIHIAERKLCLALDGVQDPGNLGTIVRIADWFGITDIFCSHETADIFNPKSVQATMGAVARVNVHYVDLQKELSSLEEGTPIYGTFMNGDNIYNTELCGNGVVVMGNEGTGITPGISSIVNHKIGIPSFPAGRPTSESLNVAVATAIVCSEFRRR